MPDSSDTSKPERVAVGRQAGTSDAARDGQRWARLQARVDRLANPWLRDLVSSMVRAHADRLRAWPAARVVHHAWRGGLLDHVLAVAELGAAAAAMYGADEDLVVAGAILHDIGKLDELHVADEGEEVVYSREGNLLGHITIGVVMVRAAASAIPGFPQELRTRLEHLIVSHHGARSLGSPVEPMTAEAFILPAVDELDATMDQFARHVSEDEGDGEFTSYHPRLRRVLLKPCGR